MLAMKQFSTKSGEADFAIDSDEFHPPAEVPAGMWVDLATLYEQLAGASAMEQFGILTKFFELILPDEEFELFKTRLDDKRHPIGLRLLVDVMEWLIGEVYGLLPTPPSSPSDEQSSTTTEQAGDISTAGAPSAESPPSISPPTDSSTSSGST